MQYMFRKKVTKKKSDKKKQAIHLYINIYKYKSKSIKEKTFNVGEQVILN